LWTTSGMRALRTLGSLSSRTQRRRHILHTAVGLCGGWVPSYTTRSHVAWRRFDGHLPAMCTVLRVFASRCVLFVDNQI
jgi:hypothetical protein